MDVLLCMINDADDTFYYYIVILVLALFVHLFSSITDLGLTVSLVATCTKSLTAEVRYQLNTQCTNEGNAH